MINLPDLMDELGRPDEWPWTVVGVFPTAEYAPADDEDFGSTGTGFNYTTGLIKSEKSSVDLWIPTSSIEGRYGGNHLMSMILNGVGWGMRQGRIGEGDDLLVPLGVPNGDDVDCIFWVGEREPNDRHRETNLSDALDIIPMRWSSGLGWEE